jgi:hypothetical protein
MRGAIEELIAGARPGSVARAHRRPRLSSRLMDAGAVNTAGGICELAGLGLAVREYVAALEHHGQLAALRRRLDERWRPVAAWWKRLRGRRDTTVHSGAGTVVAKVQVTATGQVIPAGFTPTADQSVEEQIAQLGRVVNRLRDWIQEEDQLRDRAIEAARVDARAELHAEAQRLRNLISEIDGKLQDLDSLTTGDARIRLDGLILLLVGIVFTTWPAQVAQHVLGWLSWQAFALLLVGYVAWRLVASITGALRIS